MIGLVGCGGTGDGSQSPTAAIGSQDEKATATGGAKDSSGKKDQSDPKHPVVQIETKLGSITVELDGENAPGTVDNFLSYVAAAHYDQTIVHQVYKGQGILAGGYGVNLTEKPTRTPIFNEARNGLKNRRGTISMVRRPDAKDSATSQFFINVADNAALDHKDETAEGYGYCVFGKVTKGMELVDGIANAEVRDTAEFERTPVEAIVVKTIQRIR
jgi:peptidyl-prolyl cis-trans isomerase B (cyclophilin B)